MHASRHSRSRADFRPVLVPGALLLAYVLVLQVLFAGLTQGLQASPSPLSALTSVICSPGGSTAPDAPEPADHAACCVIGCTMGGWGAAPPPSAPALASIERRHAAPTALAQRDLVPRARVHPSPRSTRGPPTAI